MKRLTASLALICLCAAGTALAAEPDRSAPAVKPFAGKKQQEKFANCDRNNDGGLDQEEFAVCYPRTQQDFTVIDANKDGRVTQEEQRVFVETRKEERRRVFFRRCDSNGDGALSEQEFLQCGSDTREKSRRKRQDKPEKMQK